MAGFADLLREAKEEYKYENITFTDINESIYAVGLVCNESIDFSCAVSLNEINFDDVKSTVGKVKDKIVAAGKALIEKIKKFISRIGESIKQLIAKAKVIVASKGNKAILKFVDNDTVVYTKKAIELSLFDPSDVNAILSRCERAIKDLNEVADAAANITRFDPTALSRSEELWDRAKVGVDALKEYMKEGDADFRKAVEKKVTIPANSVIKKVYDQHLSDLMDAVDPKKSSSFTGICQKYTKESIDMCKKGERAVSKLISKASSEQKTAEDGQFIKNAQALMRIFGEVYSNTMTVNYGVLNITFSVLRMVTKAAAKLALGSGKSKSENKDNK